MLDGKERAQHQLTTELLRQQQAEAKSAKQQQVQEQAALNSVISDLTSVQQRLQYNASEQASREAKSHEQLRNAALQSLKSRPLSTKKLQKVAIDVSKQLASAYSVESVSTWGSCTKKQSTVTDRIAVSALS